MDNVDLQVLRQVAAWRARDERVVLGTVTRTWGSAPRPIGSLVAGALDYQVTVCDPRTEYTADFAVGATRLVRTMPDDAVVEFLPDAHTAVIALTHDPKLDDLALLEALRSNAFYVGAIGSRANQAKRRERFAQHFDMAAEELSRLHGPVGLKNGARTPPGIAVAILAELTAARYGFRIPEPVRIDSLAPADAGLRLAQAA